jgi:probable F420-dependent oxidoreductase
MPNKHRLIRFTADAGMGAGPREAIAAAQNAEKLGFSTFALQDHFMTPIAPLIGLQAIAAATTTLRLMTTVLAHDFRHPAVLAKELATLDILSDGRLEIGMGAGYMRVEYEQAGIPFDKASVRIERLEEQLIILKGLFGDGPFSFEGTHYQIGGLEGSPKPAQLPHPPIFVGGGGHKLLSVAARHADIVQIASTNRGGGMGMAASEFMVKSLEEKLGWVRDAAGGRFDAIELSLPVVAVVLAANRRAGAEQALERFGAMVRMLGEEFDMSVDDVLDSPNFLVGSIDDMCEQLISTRDRYGVTSFMPFVADPALVGQLIEGVKGN